ncbi:MAG: nucleoside triphosphate pyrophosphohydrolase [Candidatus Aminicenantales bacterium]
MATPLQAGAGFARLADIIKTLRGENGCPWDKEQDETTILNYLLEEVYEVVEAVQSGKAESVREELGDVLMEVVFLAQIYEEKGAFHLAESVESINSKMIRRHPHVFGDTKLDSSARVVEEWHRQKQVEKNRDSLFDGLPRTLPALAAAFQIGQKASLVGFDWERTEEALAKLDEELQELKQALQAGEQKAIDREMGDLLFAAANVSRQAGVNPETALLLANRRFRERFAYIESRLREQGRDPAQASLPEMDALWEEAKDRGEGD